ncbi:phospholipase A1 [Halobacteriovorax sp. BALOs_7]|uniref:phospholipase A n=1 Tax=Halobacteriovorax sp. BALOs_7 TaxID=2109558 RepID=UPI000EA3A590|nr:phospholipase A [Halobacteriovorax sp. BALOs_7]AYF43093.1 phospholipase A1 [Halobacteriovorax sp. BALOs_7]
MTFQRSIYCALLLNFTISIFAQDSLEKTIQKRQKEDEASNNTISLVTAHRPNYVLPVTYMHDPNESPINDDDELKNEETKFQLSFKFTVFSKLFNSNTDLNFAYTQKSVWQLFNKKNSAAFRDTNYEPEIFLSMMPFEDNWTIFRNYYHLGFAHQSNGKDIPQSRSWNRIFFTTFFDYRETLFMLKVWYRIPEEKKTSPTDYTGDDNPDINEYMGNFELTTIHKVNGHTLSLMLRNNLRSDNKGAVELSWSFPLPETRLKGYVQYFDGYGESLIDYNYKMTRIGLGVAFTDWL